MKRWGWMVLAVSLVGCTSERAHLDAEWKKAESDAAKAGVALRPGQVMEGVNVPDDKNAAAGLRIALAKTLNSPKPGEPDLRPTYQPMFQTASKTISDELANAFLDGKQPNYQNLKSSLAVLDPILVEAEKALQRPEWDFHRPWADGVAMLMPDMAREKMLAKWFAAKAMVAAHNGNDREAEWAIAAIYRIGYHLRSEPMIIAVLVGYAAESIAERAILDIARIKPGNKALLKRLLSLQVAERRPIDWQKLWVNENAMTMDSLKYYFTKSVKPDQTEKALRAKTAITRLLIQSQEVWGEPPHDLGRLREVAQRFERRINDQYITIDPSYKESFGGKGIFETFLDSQPMVEARRRAAGIALIMVAEGLTTLPKEASQAKWLDPYSGKPMRVVKDGTGFAVYSVGENRQDDGGSQKRDAKDRLADIVISYPNRHKNEASKSD